MTKQETDALLFNDIVAKIVNDWKLAEEATRKDNAPVVRGAVMAALSDMCLRLSNYAPAVPFCLLWNREGVRWSVGRAP